ncbi:MAG: S8 family serine peptidase [Actinomycetota bacterium]|nr:S8 family serine peptidase [Actinomycetota bacterium]
MRSRTTGASAVAGALLVLANLTAASVSAAPDSPRQGLIDKVDLDELGAARAEWVQGELVVGFKSHVGRGMTRRVVAAKGARVKSRIPEFDVAVLDLPAGQSVPSAAAEYRRNPRVAFAEPNKIIRTTAIPNDPRFDELWGFHNTGQRHEISDPPPDTASGKRDADGDVPGAWDEQTGDPGTVIAVLDSGVDVGHPDLNASLWMNPLEVDNGVDDDANGYTDDVHGWDFAEDDETLLQGTPISGRAHGTHVAGTVAAERNNSAGVAGVCPGCRIMVLKFMRPTDVDDEPGADVMAGTLEAELEALAYARSEGADIVNASFSSFLWSGLERKAFVRTGNAGILTVAAAGNSSLDNDLALNYTFPDGSRAFSPEYPASFTVPEILSVAASNHKDEYGYFTGCDTRQARWRCEFTSWGHDSVDLAAPGVDIMSTIPTNPNENFAVFNGTSMATPFTSGAAGLVLSQNPTYSPMQVKNALMNSVDRPKSLRKMPAFEGGAALGKFTRTSGRVNVRDALDAATSNATRQTDGNIDGARRLRGRDSGRVNWPADTNDVYKRWFKRGRTYKVVLDGPNNKDFDLVAWKPGTKEIWQLEEGCFFGPGPCKLLRWTQRQDARAADEKFRFTAREGGNYYIQVAAYLFNEGRYTLKVRRI